jgi:hypothetical protein
MEAVESARAGLTPQEESVRKSRKEKKKTKEGKKVAPAKATFHVSQTKNSFFLVHEYWGLETPVSVNEKAPTRLALQGSHVRRQYRKWTP